MSEEEVAFPSQSHIASQLLSLPNAVRTIQSITFNLPLKEKELDRVSIRSSLRHVLSTLYKKNSVGLFHLFLILLGDMHSVFPALNLSNLDACIWILILVQHQRLMMFSLNMLDYRTTPLPLAVHLHA